MIISISSIINITKFFKYESRFNGVYLKTTFLE